MYTRYFLLKLELPYPAKHVWNAIILSQCFLLQNMFILDMNKLILQNLNYLKSE